LNTYLICFMARGSGCVVVVATSEARALESLKEKFPWLYSEENTVQLAEEGSIYFLDDRN